MIASTLHRRFFDPGHRPPKSGLNDSGGRWTGCSRVQDRAARRRANRLTWAKEKAAARRQALARKRLDQAIAEAAA